MIDPEIAIIGMAGRFPGAQNVAEFWSNVQKGVESIRTLSDEELLAAGVPAAQLRDPAYVKACPVLEGVDQFDAGFFGMSPRDASVMDPAHRLFLETAWEAVEHSGYTALPAEGVVGVFAGSGAPYYLMDHVRRDAAVMRTMGEFLVRHTGNDMNFLATRVSYEMDLRGPSINVQTACSSALVAIHMACESIRRGDCAMALAGGSTVLIPDRQGYLYQEGEILSPDGHCRPFDERSAGTVFGSGAGCVVLKLLSAALDDGDTIHAVVKGSAVNNDGALRVGYLAPGVEGQAAVVQMALDRAGVSADSIGYIETHGTGTSVGDPIEVAGLNQAFRDRTARRHFCAIGSVKSNVGHLGEAAGVASLIKAVMSLANRQLAPSLGYEKPNPHIEFDDSPFFVNDTLRPWASDGPRRCGVTALGAGGTNCHVILEEAPPRLDGEGARDAQLLVFSAKTEEALDSAGANIAHALDSDTSLDLADAAYTLAVGRRAMPHRAALVIRSAGEGAKALLDRNAKQLVVGRADEREPPVAFLFPGGGAQYPGMGRDLFAGERVYCESIEACFASIDASLAQELRDAMFGDRMPRDQAAQLLGQPLRSLPSLFSTEYALAKLFESWGVRPSAFVGHSMGEYVAACLAGVMTLADALKLVTLRGRLFQGLPAGRMLSVPMPERELRALIPSGVDIAAVNAPAMCTASGSIAAIEALERLLGDRGVESARIRIDVAAHSAMLEPVLQEFRETCRTIAFRPPQIPFVSNLTGRWITDTDATDPEYWVKHLRSTVRFADGMATLSEAEPPVVIEMGPGRALATLARAQQTPPRTALNAMRLADDVVSDVDHALATLGRLWVAGARVDWEGLYEGQLRNRVPLPTYPWQHERHWIDAARIGDVIVADTHVRRGIEEWFARPSWRQTPPPPPIVARDESVLVFAGTTGLGEALCARLAAAGRRVWRVVPDSAWKQTGETFHIAPDSLPDYERLLKTLSAQGGLPKHVVHAWGLAFVGEHQSLDDVVARGFRSLLCFAQALAGEDPDAALKLDVLTRNLQRVGGETLLQPAHALILGPARVMPQEFPGIRSRCIDVVLPESLVQLELLAALVAAELASESDQSTVAYRGHDRFVQSLEGVRMDRVTPRLRERGVYLITGGFGGIGYTLAEHLARTHRAKLVLIGRSAGGSAVRARTAALEALGSEVEVVPADVTSVDAMRAALTRAHTRFGVVNGVFHTAGVLGDSLMSFKTQADAERVLAPKVRGALAIDAALGDAPLDLFVLFSSISSLAGLPGQADYTAANAFLDAFAQERSLRDGTFAVAINWSAWRDVGMAANISSAGEVRDTRHPLLGRRIWASGGEKIFSSELSPASQWVLAEHRLRGGRSLMPGTGLVEIARAAVATDAESRPLELRDVAFISAFAANDDAPRELRVRVSSEEDGGRRIAGSRVAIASRSESEGAPHWQEHLTATASYAVAERPADIDIASIAARCTRRIETVAGTERDAHMNFGARWHNIQSSAYGTDEALLTLELPAKYAADFDDFVLHPALLDMATGGAQTLIPGWNWKTDFYVPLGYGQVRIFGALPSRIYSHVRLVPSELDPSENAVFNATITDDAGHVLVEVTDFMMTRLSSAARIEESISGLGLRESTTQFDPPAVTSTPPMLRGLDTAISPAEGMDALERILAGPALPQLFATPVAASVLMDELRRAEPGRASTKAAPAAPTVPVGDVEAALATHEAVRECAVMQRTNRTGRTTLVAYVVHDPDAHATVSDLRRFLKARLPAHLVPSTLIDLDSLPRTRTGEVDRAALPDPFGNANEFVAPRTDTERMIAGIWQEVLGIDRVSIRDNFFDAGGHSLLAVRVITRINKAIGVRLSQTMMVLQTLEQIAAECDRRGATPSSSASIRATPPAGSTLVKRLFRGLRRE